MKGRPTSYGYCTCGKLHQMSREEMSEAELEELRSRASAAEATVLQHEQDITLLSNRIVHITSLWTAAQNERNDLAARLAAAQGEVTTLHVLVDQLQDRLSALRGYMECAGLREDFNDSLIERTRSVLAARPAPTEENDG